MLVTFERDVKSHLLNYCQIYCAPGALNLEQTHPVGFQLETKAELSCVIRWGKLNEKGNYHWENAIIYPGVPDYFYV